MSMRLPRLTTVALLLLATQRVFADGPPCSCLVDRWVDYPGPYDLYVADVHDSSCDDVPYQMMWWGKPGSDIPQSCEDGACEPYAGDGERAASVFPGHGQELVGVKAWEMFHVGLEAAVRKKPGSEFGSPEYHVISRANLPKDLNAKADITVMAIPMKISAPGSRLDGETLYFCVQMDSAEGLPITHATFENGKSGPGSQLRIDYRVKKGEVRRGLVWLK
jgi:hypothetical protein